MLRLKSFISRILPRTQNNVYKLYSKPAEQLGPVINVTENQKDAIPEITTKATINEIPITTDPISTQLQKITESCDTTSESKKTTGCSNRPAPKSKKGKKCGQPKPIPPQDPGPPGGYYIQDKCGIYDIPKANSKKWRTISYALIPFALGLSALVLATKEELPEPDYIPYEYMYRRTKRFAWRDGKTSLFHGPNNLIPEEEEERLDREAEEKQANVPPPTPTKKGDPPPPPPEKEIRYKKHISEEEEKIKKRDQHAREELERRKRRHEVEGAKN